MVRQAARKPCAAVSRIESRGKRPATVKPTSARPEVRVKRLHWQLAAILEYRARAPYLLKRYRMPPVHRSGLGAKKDRFFRWIDRFLILLLKP
jgi:hypothetical protein